MLNAQGTRVNRWFDPVLATILLILCELEVLADLHRDGGHNHWPVTINALLVVGMTIPIIWRRLAPEISGCIVIISFSVLVTWGSPMSPTSTRLCSRCLFRHTQSWPTHRGAQE